MPLTVNDQLNVLYDLLSEQCEDGCGTIAECEQIARLVHSLQAKLDDDAYHDFRSQLPAIYKYSSNLHSDDQFEDHIISNQANLKQWTNALSEIKDL
ncbi:YtzH-like family protein [Thalassobacillus pellis]|uniref:YtzH-like family protein n=1 Tax=Thalassobacillus pellis TaxID=748008 RepID=UPI00195FB725|nr:YtzH-like family protein [Thalassobacillus pellis]MBM7554916.1 hypothetical protein [Thalassobacillus pellis]